MARFSSISRAGGLGANHHGVHPRHLRSPDPPRTFNIGNSDFYVNTTFPGSGGSTLNYGFNTGGFPVEPGHTVTFAAGIGASASAVAETSTDGNYGMFLASNITAPPDLHPRHHGAPRLPPLTRSPVPARTGEQGGPSRNPDWSRSRSKASSHR